MGVGRGGEETSHLFSHLVWVPVLHQSHSLTQTPVHCFILLLQCPMGFVSMRLVGGRRLALGTHAIGPGLGTQMSRGRCVEEGHLHHLPRCHMPASHPFFPPGHLFHVFLPLCPVYSRGCVSMIFAGEEGLALFEYTIGAMVKLEASRRGKMRWLHEGEEV